MSVSNIQGFLFLLISILYVVIGCPVIAIIPATLGTVCFVIASYKDKT